MNLVNVDNGWATIRLNADDAQRLARVCDLALGHLVGDPCLILFTELAIALFKSLAIAAVADGCLPSGHRDHYHRELHDLNLN